MAVEPGSQNGEGDAGEDPSNYDLTLPESAFDEVSKEIARERSGDGPGSDPSDTASVPGVTVPPPKRMPKLEPATEAPEIADVTVTELLGRGGQGVVFRGFQEFLQRDVAIKVLHRSIDRDLARFQKEATLLASLQHPNIVACYQAGVGEDGECYMVLEFVNGPDLFQYVKTHGALDEDTALALAMDVAHGLQHGYEHNSRMIHRDVKPQNILIQTNDSGSGRQLRAKVVDLGLARCLEESMELTRPGAVMGTPVSMAPEQFDCPGEVDHRTDIYGLGCVIFYAITGDPAFKGATLTAIYRQKTAQKSARPHKDLDLHPGTRALLDKMLAPEQSGRPADYETLLVEIGKVRELLKEERSGPSPKQRKPWLVPMAGVGVLAAGAAGYFGVTGGKSDPGGDRSGASSVVADGEMGESPGAIPDGGSDGEATSSDPEGSSGAGTPIGHSGPAELDPKESDPDESGAGPESNAGIEPATGSSGGATAQPGFEALSFLPALGKGLSRELMNSSGVSESWIALAGSTSGDASRDVHEDTGWRFDTSGGKSWIEIDQPKNFQDPRRSQLSALDFVTALRARTGVPMPFYVPGAGCLSHPVPQGRWTLEGDFALCKRAPGAYLLGGLVLHRADGSYLEVVIGDYNASEVPAAEQGAKGLPKSSRCLVRAMWFDAAGVPLLDGNIRGNDAPGKTPAERSRTLLGSRGGELEPEREYVAITVRVVAASKGSINVLLGDDRDLFLEAPEDLSSNPVKQVTAFAQVGDVTLRRWRFCGPE